MQFLPLPVSLFFILITIIARCGFIKWRQRKTARRLGCEPIVKYPHTLPFGLDLIRDRKKAVKAGRPNKFNMEVFEKCGSSTYVTNTFTGNIIYTTEAVNHQALAATKFHDWRKDDRRAAEAFFGQGILSSNGHVWRHARDLVNPLFKRAELNDVENFEKFVNRTIALIPRDGQTLDMQPLFQKLVRNHFLFMSHFRTCVIIIS